MNTEKLIRALATVGLTKFKAVNVWDGDVCKPGIMIEHDYTGLYPGVDQLEMHAAACKVARRLGLRAENRGHYTATLIY